MTARPGGCCLGCSWSPGWGWSAYMNFRPGFSLAVHRGSEADDHEVRERDYFFVVSFIVWGLWAGIGAAALAGAAAATARLRLASRRTAPGAVSAGAQLGHASRRHGPDARLAADFAYDLLNSAPPYGILFTYGDNDTFPLWWAQEVAGIRQDVTVVCLALANTDWYMRQLRDSGAPGEPSRAPQGLERLDPERPSGPLHGMNDSTGNVSDEQVLCLPAPDGEARSAHRELEPGIHVNDIGPGRHPGQSLGLPHHVGCYGGRSCRPDRLRRAEVAGLSPQVYEAPRHHRP